MITINNNIKLSNELPFVLIGGPCQLESEDHALMLASEISKITTKFNIPYVFKGSFDKANRTSISGKRGVGMEEGLKILQAVKNKIGCAVTTDVHEPDQCSLIADTVDIIQIPALLCRQTDLILAAAKTNRIVTIKKGQFIAPWNMKHIVTKAESTGNNQIAIIERGTCFGYNNLVSDMRGLEIMKNDTNCPIIFDASHSVQAPSNNSNGSSGGDRYFTPVLARAAIASTKIAGIFMEIHQDPDNAPSDGPSMTRLDELEKTLFQLKKIDDLVKGF